MHKAKTLFGMVYWAPAPPKFYSATFLSLQQRTVLISETKKQKMNYKEEPAKSGLLAPPVPRYNVATVLNNNGGARAPMPNKF